MKGWPEALATKDFSHKWNNGCTVIQFLLRPGVNNLPSALLVCTRLPLIKHRKKELRLTQRQSINPNIIKVMQDKNLFSALGPKGRLTLQEQELEQEFVTVKLGEALEANERIREHGYDYTSGNPAVYCGTYRKYNEGSIDGAWLDLASFKDYDEFMEVCRLLHRDEEDPELMFQDYENFPRDWYTESCMDEETFDKIKKYAEMAESRQEAFDDYMDTLSDDDFDSFEEAYCGEWDSEEDFAQQLVNDCYNIDNMMGSLSSYFDYKAFARDLFMTDYTMGEHGHVFRVL